MSLSRSGGYGDYSASSMFTQQSSLGRYNDFNETDANGAGGDAAVGGRSSGIQSLLSMSGQAPMRAASTDLSLVAQEVIYIKQENHQIRNAVIDLEKDRDNLRQAIRKLKVENSRMKQKMKRMAEVMQQQGGAGMEVDMNDLNEMDFDEIRDYILIGGPFDPFSLRYEVAIKDAQNVEHKSAERYFWYKMAETFGDKDCGERIRTAATTQEAEEKMKGINGFDENVWNGVKLRYWEEAQKLKMDQVRWIQNLLVYSGSTYIAVASQDKVFGTGWRKNRQEATQTRMWDGENQGGRILMRLRDSFKAAHTWMGPYEEQETEKKYKELKQSAWRRQDNRDSRGGGFGGRGGGGRGGSPRGAGRGFPKRQNRP